MSYVRVQRTLNSQTSSGHVAPPPPRGFFGLRTSCVTSPPANLSGLQVSCSLTTKLAPINPGHQPAKLIKRYLSQVVFSGLSVLNHTRETDPSETIVWFDHHNWIKASGAVPQGQAADKWGRLAHNWIKYVCSPDYIITFKLLLGERARERDIIWLAWLEEMSRAARQL